jgi:hypothetical protein
MKETSFFKKESLFLKGPEFYVRNFFDQIDSRPLVDVDPDLIYDKTVPSRIKQSYGDSVKCFVILRDPALRAFSHYQMECYRGHEKKTFFEAIELEHERLKNESQKYRYSYLDRGYYARQLNHLFMHIPSSSVKVFLFEKDFLRDKTIFFKELCAFMDVPFQDSLELDIWENPARKVKSRFVDLITRRNRLFILFTTKLMPKEMGKKLRYSIQRKNAILDDLQILTDQDRVEINHKYFKEDILELSRMINRDLSHWLS